jgi:hypothetical protein
VPPLLLTGVGQHGRAELELIGPGGKGAVDQVTTSAHLEVAAARCVVCNSSASGRI